MNKKSRFFLLLVALFLPVSLPAALQFWDPNGATPGTSISGNWDSLTTNWTDTVDSGVNAVWTQGNDATFGVLENDYTVALSEPITVQNLSVLGVAGALTITGNPV